MPPPANRRRPHSRKGSRMRSGGRALPAARPRPRSHTGRNRGASFLPTHWNFDRCRLAAAAHRFICGLEHADHPQSVYSVGRRNTAAAYAVDKVFALGFQRLALFDPRYGNVAVAIGELKVAVGIIVTADIHSLVVDA